MEVKYSETEHLLNALKAIANQSSNRDALRQQFVGDVIDKGMGDFKDVKINTYIKVLKDDLPSYQKALEAYFKEASKGGGDQPDDKHEELAKWFLQCILESVNESMFSILCELMSAVLTDYEKKVNDKPDAYAEYSKKAAEGFYKITKKGGFLQPWQDILAFEEGLGVQLEQVHSYQRILTILSEVMEKRYNVGKKEDAEANKDAGYDALLNIYINGLLNPIMGDLKAFSVAHDDPGLFVDSTKTTDKLIIPGDRTISNGNKNLLKNGDSDGFYRFYPEANVVKEWFQYLLGFTDKTPSVKDSDFKKKAQQFHDSIKHTYEAMDEGWGSISTDSKKDVSQKSADTGNGNSNGN